MLEGYRLQVIDDLLRLNDPIPVARTHHHLATDRIANRLRQCKRGGSHYT